MANTTIPNLPLAVSLDGSEQFEIVQAGTSKRTTLAVAAPNSSAILASPNGAALVGFKQAGTGAIARTVQDELRDRVSVKQFGAKGDGVTDDTTAIQAALNDLGAYGTLIFPAGNYKITGNFTVTVATFGTLEILIEGGAVINHSGSGYCFSCVGSGTPYAGVNISGNGEIVGTSAGSGGIIFKNFNKGYIGKIRVRGYTNSAGVEINGANAITCDAEVSSCKYGYWLHSTTASYQANSVTLRGHVANCSVWGVFDDASGAGGAGAANVYEMTFDPCGGVGTAGTGNIFIQGSNGCIIQSYLEQSSANYGPYNVVIGDGTHHPIGTKIAGSTLLGYSASTASIYDNGTGTIIDGSIELASIPLVFGGPNGTQRYIGPCRGYFSSLFTGTDNGDTVSFGNNPSTLANSIKGDVTGIGIKTLSGFGAPLKIRAQGSGDTTIAEFQNYGGSAAARVNTNGGFQPGAPDGTFAATNAVYQGAGIPNNTNGANGDVYFRYDTPGTANQRIYIKIAGTWTGIV